MRKEVLTPEECGGLIPHWPEIDLKKIDRLRRMMTRYSKFYGDIRPLVMGSIPILTTEEGYIVNGKHRAVWAHHKGYNLETYIVSDGRDIQFHTPHKAFGEVGLEGALEAFVNRGNYIERCYSQGIYSVKDLYVKNKAIFLDMLKII